MNDYDLRFLQTAYKISEIDDNIGKIAVGDIFGSDIVKAELQDAKDHLMDVFVELWIETDRIEIREIEYPFLKDIVQQVRDKYKLTDLWAGYNEKILDTHENGGILNRGTFLGNYYDLKPPYVKVGTNIPNGLKSIYNEARYCYVYGQYSACIALSRTVLEIVLKDKLSIIDTDNMCLAMLIESAFSRNVISKTTYHRAIQIKNRANGILHKADTAKSGHAYGALDHILEILEEIYLNI